MLKLDCQQELERIRNDTFDSDFLIEEYIEGKEFNNLVHPPKSVSDLVACRFH